MTDPLCIQFYPRHGSVLKILLHSQIKLILLLWIRVVMLRIRPNIDEESTHCPQPTNDHGDSDVLAYLTLLGSLPIPTIRLTPMNGDPTIPQSGAFPSPAVGNSSLGDSLHYADVHQTSALNDDVDDHPYSSVSFFPSARNFTIRDGRFYAAESMTIHQTGKSIIPSPVQRW